jgi:hypothetical protein
MVEGLINGCANGITNEELNEASEKEKEREGVMSIPHGQDSPATRGRGRRLRE